MDERPSSDVRSSLTSAFPHISSFLIRYPINSERYRERLYSTVGSGLVNVLAVRLARDIFLKWGLDTRAPTQSRTIHGVKVTSDDVLAWVGYTNPKTFINTRSDIETLTLVYKFLVVHEAWALNSEHEGPQSQPGPFTKLRDILEVYFGDELMELLRLQRLQMLDDDRRLKLWKTRPNLISEVKKAISEVQHTELSKQLANKLATVKKSKSSLEVDIILGLGDCTWATLNCQFSL